MQKLFIAGATGAVGRTLLRQAEATGADVVPHLRPKTAAQGKSLHPKAVMLELSQTKAVAEALKSTERTTILQLIGTMKKRFGAGDTYETSDIGTTQQLVDAAKLAGTVNHLVLLSSIGAGNPAGAYLKAKARAEAIVQNSGLPFTIFRPSAFMGEGHHIPGVFKTLTKLLGAKRYEPIEVEELARALLKVAQDRAPLNAILEGEALWTIVRSG